jgi:hypothetical protein
MIEKAILHIGLHKTGSSSIQESLKGYDDGTSFYADLDWINHSIPLYTGFSQECHQYHIWTKRGYSIENIQEIKNQALNKLEKQLSRPNRNTIIFSGEDLSRLSQDDANTLVAFMRKRCRHIIAIAYVRDPLDYAASAVQEFIKAGCKQIPNLISQDIETRINIWEQALGAENTYIRLFDREALTNGCVVQDFCKVTGLDFKKIKVKRRNESLRGPAIKVLFHLNQTSPLQFGDTTLIRTRERFINLMVELFADLPSLNKNLMHGHVDPQDIEYIKSKRLLNPTDSQTDSIYPTDETLIEWLRNLDEEIHNRLSEWLAKENRTTHWNSPTADLIHRTFYEILRSDTNNKNARLFVKCAFLLRESTNHGQSECIELLEIAQHGKPLNKRIKQLLREFRQLEGRKNQALT